MHKYSMGWVSVSQTLDHDLQFPGVVYENDFPKWVLETIHKYVQTNHTTHPSS